MHNGHFGKREFRSNLVSVGAVFDYKIDVELLCNSNCRYDVVGSMRVRPKRNSLLYYRDQSFLPQIPRPLLDIRGIVLRSYEGFSKYRSDTHSGHWTFFK